MPSSHSQIEAERVRSDLGLGSGQIDVFDVARRLGAEVYFHPFGGDGVEGAYKRVGGLPFILINADRPLVRRRYSMAHEIGHMRLGLNDAGVVESIGTMNSPDVDERNANRFAAYLLMDAEGVRSLVADLDEPWAMIARVATEYLVSPAAAAIHLADLGLLSQADKDQFLSTAGTVSTKRRLTALGYMAASNEAISALDRIDPRHLDDALTEFADGQYSREALAADLDLSPAEADALIERRNVAQPGIVSELNLEGFDDS